MMVYVDHPDYESFWGKRIKHSTDHIVYAQRRYDDVVMHVHEQYVRGSLEVLS